MFDANTDTWAERYQRETDVVPDPMILRSAELFIGGRTYARQLALPGEDRERKVDDTWDAISRNQDGLLAFFDALITRDRIPLIDYEATFPSSQFDKYLGDLVFPVHPDRVVYETIKKAALEKIGGLDFTSLPEEMLKDIHSEMGAFGYEWFPDVGIDVPYLNRAVAGFLLGGIIFGGYAQATGTQHLLQTKRARLFAALSVPQDEAPLWGYQKEKELFGRLSEYASADPGLCIEHIRTPPTVLPHLIRQGNTPKSTTEILHRALDLRCSAIGKEYRTWHRKLRDRWALGHHDDAENEVEILISELKRRLSDEPAWATRVDMEANLAVGQATLKVNAKDVRISVPNKIRNWIVDVLPFRGYRKLLLRIVLDQRAYDNLTLGLKRLWYAT